MTFDPQRYALTDVELRSRFLSTVLPQLEAVAQPSDSPTAIVVGAQPGAGKTSTMTKAVNAHNEPVVIVNADNFRDAHPHHRALMADQPQNMPAATDQASGAWLRMGLETAAAQRWNVAWETTLRSTDALLVDLSRFAEAGYSVDLYVMAVPRATSLLGTAERYLDMVDTYGSGRSVTVDRHDEPFAKAPETVAKAAAVSGVNIKVVDRDFNVLHPGQFSQPVVALRAGRTLGGEALAEVRRGHDRARIRMQNQPKSGNRKTVRDVLRAVDGEIKSASQPPAGGAGPRQYFADHRPPTTVQQPPHRSL
jgi:predicted ABC-type ATPase